MGLFDCKFVWKNGTIVRWEDATFHVSCHALHYGTGAFEGIRCYLTVQGAAVFRLQAHLDRWVASGRMYGMSWPYTNLELERAVLEVIRANQFCDCYVRPIAFYGSDSLSLNPRGCPVEVVIFAWPWQPYLGGEALEHGIDVTISKWRKFSSRSIPTTAKASGQYVNSVLATQDAVARGFHEAILLDDAGRLSEGSGENLFLVHDGQLVTNGERSSVLLGITRDSVIHLAKNGGLQVHVRDLNLDELLRADEAFLTGTAAEIAPIARVDGQKVGSASPGPLTSRLQREFFDVVRGHDTRYLDWLTYVSAGTRNDSPTQQ